MSQNEKDANEFDLNLFILIGQAAFLGNTAHGKKWLEIVHKLQQVRPLVRVMMSKEDCDKTQGVIYL